MFKPLKKAMAIVLTIGLLMSMTSSLLQAKPLNEDPPDIPPIIIVKPPPPPLSM